MGLIGAIKLSRQAWIRIEVIKWSKVNPTFKGNEHSVMWAVFEIRILQRKF